MMLGDGSVCQVRYPAGEFLAFFRGKESTDAGFCRMSEAGNAAYVINWNKYMDGEDSDGIARLMNDCGLLKKPNAIARVHTYKANQKHIKFIALVSIAKTRKFCITMEVWTYRGE